MKKISQREARRLQKRVIELNSTLQRQKNSWASDWGAGWVNIETLVFSDVSFAKVRTARKLGHAVVLVPADRGNDILLYAVKL